VPSLNQNYFEGRGKVIYFDWMSESGIRRSPCPRGYVFTLRSCLLLVAGPALLASSSASPVTVLLNYEQPYSQSSFAALQQQLQATLDATGLKLDIRDRSASPAHEQLGEVVLFKMRGTCSMSAIPVGAFSDERGPLAMAYSSNGSVLPFGEVECDRVRQSLERILGKSNGARHQTEFGVALGMVIAHELYHMLGQSIQHTRHGVTKESLSARELLEGSLPLPEIARHAMQQRSPLE
jgi:hypothetical protein